MVLADHIEPSTEIVHLMARKFAVEMLIDIHDGILSSFWLSEIFKTHTIHQLHVAQEQRTQCIAVTSGAKAFDEYFIRYLLGGQYLLFVRSNDYSGVSFCCASWIVSSITSQK